MSASKVGFWLALAFLLMRPAVAEETAGTLALEEEISDLDARRASLQLTVDALKQNHAKSSRKTYDVRLLVPATDKFPKQRMASLIAAITHDLRLEEQAVSSSVIESTVTIDADGATHKRIAGYLKEIEAAKRLLESRGFEVRPQTSFNPSVIIFSFAK